MALEGRGIGGGGDGGSDCRRPGRRGAAQTHDGGGRRRGAPASHCGGGRGRRSPGVEFRTARAPCCEPTAGTVRAHSAVPELVVRTVGGAPAESGYGRGEWFLDDGGENLAVVLAGFQGEAKRRFVGALGELAGIADVSCPVTGGAAALFLEERGGRRIPATRLSDGTLRYLSLLALDQPELGLHPEVVGEVAGLLGEAAERTQIVVTTHSRMLVDALTGRPSRGVVCEKENGESRFERLDGTRLKAWLEKYSLGELWGSGKLGGNRW